MNCFPESTYAVYVDGELPSEERRGVEAHLVRCRDCRALVLALRDEANLLVQVLQERERTSFAAAARPAPARGLALGLLPSLALAGIAMVGVGWLLEARLPSALGWLNPLQLLGAYEMAFDLIFLLRNQVPGLLEFLVGVAATASLAALGTFAAGLLVRRWAGPALALAYLPLVLSPSPASAFELRHEENFRVAAAETVEGTLVVSGETVDVDGVVAGDLFVFAERLNVRGEVRGNLFAFVRRLEVAGAVSGSLHVLARDVSVAGEVTRDVYSCSGQFTLAEGARVGRDASLLARSAVVAGAVGRDLFMGGRSIEVRGSIARDLEAHADRVALLDTARIGRDVDAMLGDESDLAVAPGARVAGETRTTLHERLVRNYLARYGEPHFYLLLCIHIAAAFVVGMVLYALLPGIFGERLETAGVFFRSLGIGFLTLVASPIALLIVAVTLVGIPLAVIGGLLYLAALYVSGILVAALIGSGLVRSEGEWTAFALALLVGLLILGIATHLPFLGWLIRVLAVFLGLGLLVERARHGWRVSRRLPA